MYPNPTRLDLALAPAPAPVPVARPCLCPGFSLSLPAMSTCLCG